MPKLVEKALKANDHIVKIAEEFKDAHNFLYLGRGVSFPVALEGALKLKEISYIHAEGYPAAEMKHGPIALIDEEMPVFVIATKGASYEKVVSNIQEVKARKGKIVAIVTEGDTMVKELADHVIDLLTRGRLADGARTAELLGVTPVHSTPEVVGSLHAAHHPLVASLAFVQGEAGRAARAPRRVLPR